MWFLLMALFLAQDKEQVLATSIAEDIERSSTMFDHPATLEYLNRVAGKLACSPAPVSVKVIVASEPDAFVSLGGRLYLHTGFLRSVQNEAELAGVLAHLVSYKPVQPRQRTLGGLRVYFGPYSYRTGLTMAPPAIQAEARNAMREADTGAIECLDKTGYDPDAFIEALKKLDAGRLEHAATVQAALPAKREYILDTAGFARLKRELGQAPGVERALRPPRRPPSLARPHRNEHNRNHGPSPDLTIPVLRHNHQLLIEPPLRRHQNPARL
jgi:hypothetical protein